MKARKKIVLAALGLGLACGAAFGIAVYLGLGDQYTATSMVRIKMQEESMFNNQGVGLVDRDRFEIFKAGQQEALLSRMVLMSALRKPEVKDIPIVQHETLYSDPVDWLMNRLSVSFPGNSEYMAVSVTLPDPKEAKDLVNAVVNSYIDEVVNAEGAQKQQRFNRLDKICNEEVQNMRETRERLKVMLAVNHASETEQLTVSHRLLLEEMAVYRSETVRNEFEIAKVRGELAAQRTLLMNVDESGVPQTEIDLMLQNDPMARQLSIELGLKLTGQANTEHAAKPGISSGHVTNKYDQEVATLKRQFDEKLKEIESKARQNRRKAVETEVIRLTALLRPLEEQQNAAAQKIATLAAQAANIGSVSVDTQMDQANLKALELVVNNFTSDRERLRAELDAPPRITVSEPAELPLAPSNAALRLALAGIAMLVAFCCVAAVVIVGYALTRRTKTVDG